MYTDQLEVLAYMRPSLPLQYSHDNQECQGVHDRSSGDAVNKPFRQGISHIQLAPQFTLRCVPPVALDIFLIVSPFFDIFGSLALRWKRICWKLSFEELLPMVVGRRGD